MSAANLQRGQTILIVKRSRALAGLPAIEGVITDTYLKGERIYAISAKVSAAKPQMFPMREVCAGNVHAHRVTRAILNDAEDDALIAYARARAQIDHARAEDANRVMTAVMANTHNTPE
jgi:hypothetical protein